MKVIERLYAYMEFKGLQARSFEVENSLSDGYLRKTRQKDSDISEGIICTILKNHPDLNIEWLLLGKGRMINDDAETKVEAYHSQVAIGKNINQQKDVVESSTADVEMLKAKIASLERELQQKDETIRAKDETLQLYKQLLGKN